MASFAERVRLASRALVGVFTDDAAKQAFGLLQGIFPGAAGAPPQRGARERAAAHADIPWLHPLAHNVARPPPPRGPRGPPPPPGGLAVPPGGRGKGPPPLPRGGGATKVGGGRRRPC